MPEPILKQDGETKNDCERNSLKRFLLKFRQDHPHLRVIATLDALYANAPVIRDLRAALIPWIIRVKPEGNEFLFKQVRQLAEQGLTEEFEAVGSDGMFRHYRLAWNVPLNESNPDVLVDFLDVDGTRFPRRGAVFHFHPGAVAGSLPRAGRTLDVGRASSLENRKRNVQHVEEPRLPLRAQLWSWTPAPVGGAGNVDAARLLGRPDPAALLSPVCGRLGEVHQQAGLVGTPPRDLPPIPGEFDAGDLRSRAFGEQAAREGFVGFVAVGRRLSPQASR